MDLAFCVSVFLRRLVLPGFAQRPLSAGAFGPGWPARAGCDCGCALDTGPVGPVKFCARGVDGLAAVTVILPDALDVVGVPTLEPAVSFSFGISLSYSPTRQNLRYTICMS